MPRRPRFVAVCGIDGSGLLLGTDQQGRAAGTVGTILRMGPGARGWRTATAQLPDGTRAEAKRRRLLRGGFEFTFDRVLPVGTEVVFVGRPLARMPRGPDDVQWWERVDPRRG
jgi:hypothetical protein